MEATTSQEWKYAFGNNMLVPVAMLSDTGFALGAYLLDELDRALAERGFTRQGDHVMLAIRAEDVERP
jgi:hypothetical protein